MKFPKLSDIKNLNDLKKIGADLAGQALSTVDGLSKPTANLSTPVDEQLKAYEVALNTYADLFERQKEAFTALKSNYEVLKASVGTHLGKPAESPPPPPTQTPTVATAKSTEAAVSKEEEKTPSVEASTETTEKVVETSEIKEEEKH